MDIGSIFLILALFVLVVLFVGRPFMETKALSSANTVSEEEQQISALLAERDRLLNALQELDFDHALGKIPDEDYPAQRAVLMRSGTDILKKLDSLQAQPAEDDIEARIEAAIAARRADASRVAAGAYERVRANVVAQVAAPDDDIEKLLASRRRVRQEKAGGFCTQCGGPVQKSDRFCPKCGARVIS
jgi:hypothetical protein